MLRPGARLCVLEFFRPTALFVRVMHRIYNQTLLPLVGWAVTGDREAYRYLPRSIGRFDSTASTPPARGAWLRATCGRAAHPRDGLGRAGRAR